MLRQTTAWPTEHVNQLVSLWRDGNSASQIAEKLTAQFGVRRTRNSVIGAVHRRGLQRRIDPHANGTARTEKVRRARRTRPVVMRPQPPERPPEPIPVEPLHIPFLDRETYQCRAITDSTRYAQKVCGHPIEGTGVYCRWHHAIHNVAPDPKKKPRAR
jgi:hypothetical protein